MLHLQINIQNYTEAKTVCDKVRDLEYTCRML